MKKKFTSTIFFCALAVVFGIAFAHNVFAAEMSVVVGGNTTVDQNQTLTVSVVLDTQGDSANAVQAEITYPANLFNLGEINDGGSAVSFWITPPAESSSTPGEIDLAGIIPGGFSGSQGNIFSFTLQPLTTGTGTIEIVTSTVLANDGQGTPLSVSLANAIVTIDPSNSTSSTPSAPSNDYTPPNAFTPQIVSDPNIFGGKYFLVFNTTDNESGIDHYEVLEVPSGSPEKPFSSWQVATSPYLLTDQTLSSDIYVRAVDHNGNFIVVKLPARYPSPYRNKFDLLVIISSLLIVVLLILWIWHRRKHI